MVESAAEHRLTRLLAPDSVALLGASTVPNVAGNDMVLELEVSRYPGRVYPVNPKYDVNPLAVSSRGCVALDALVIPHAALSSTSTKHTPRSQQ